MYGDDTEDFMAKSAVKWLQKTFHINVLTMSPDKKITVITITLLKEWKKLLNS